MGLFLRIFKKDRSVVQVCQGFKKYMKILQAKKPYRISVGCPENVCPFDRLTRYVEDLGETKALLDAIREGAPETPILFVMTYAENKTSGLHSQDIMVRTTFVRA